jgi:hypothetical protein
VSAACLLLASKVEECQCAISLILRAVNSVRTGLSQAETLAETALEVGGAPDAATAAAATAAAAAAPRRHEVPTYSALFTTRLLRNTGLRQLSSHSSSDLMCKHGLWSSLCADASLTVESANVCVFLLWCATHRHGQRGRQAVWKLSLVRLRYV